MTRVGADATVAVISEFDGFHRGHQALLQDAKRLAVASGTPLVAAILDRGDRPALTPIARRCELLLRAGATMVVAVTSPGDLGAALPGRMRVRRAVLAQPPASTHELRWPRLRTTLAADGVDIIEVPRTHDEAGGPLTSDRVRDHVGAGRVAAASRLLGRHHEISGVVDLGAQRSHRTGFPTANVALGPDRVWPRGGVYAAWARVDGTVHAAAVNVGTRPTISGPAGTAMIEAHLLDFDGPLYGKTIDVALVEFLRPEHRFRDHDALIRQVADDVSATRTILDRG